MEDPEQLRERLAAEMRAAIGNLESAIAALRAIEQRGNWTIKEMREIRTLLLSTVRHHIDDRACGHMPDKRHY